MGASGGYGGFRPRLLNATEMSLELPLVESFGSKIVVLQSCAKIQSPPFLCTPDCVSAYMCVCMVIICLFYIYICIYIYIYISHTHTHIMLSMFFLFFYSNTQTYI